jgi:hypothetical protein
LIYGCTAAPSAKDWNTTNNDPETVTFSWEVSTISVDVPGMKPTAHIVIDSTLVDATALQKLEDALYGTESEEAHLPLPEEIASIFKSTKTVEA